VYLYTKEKAKRFRWKYKCKSLFSRARDCASKHGYTRRRITARRDSSIPHI